MDKQQLLHQMGITSDLDDLSPDDCNRFLHLIGLPAGRQQVLDVLGAIPAGVEKELERRRLNGEAVHRAAADQFHPLEARLGNIEAMLREILHLMKARTDAV